MPRSGPDHSLITVKGIIGSFYRRFEDVLGGSWAPRIGTLISSNQQTETYPFLGMVPQLREWKGGRHAVPLRDGSFTLTNVDYEATLPFSKDDLRRDKTGQMMIRVQDLARRAAQHWEQLVTDVITTNSTTYDGSALFADAHVWGDSGNQDNDLAAANVPALNVTTAAAPTEDEMVDALVGVISKMYAFLDDRGQPINGDARNFAVMVPTNLMGSTMAAVRSSLRKSGSDNKVGLQNFDIEVIVNPRLDSDSTTEFYVFRTDVAAKAFILQDEVGPESEVIGPGSEHAFKNRQYLWGLYASRAVGPGEPLVAARATLS